MNIYKVTYVLEGKEFVSRDGDGFGDYYKDVYGFVPITCDDPVTAVRALKLMLPEATKVKAFIILTDV